jgi:NTE family protein
MTSDSASGLSKLPGQIVLVIQGGGAPGSYQAGAYQAPHEAGHWPSFKPPRGCQAALSQK